MRQILPKRYMPEGIRAFQVSPTMFYLVGNPTLLRSKELLEIEFSLPEPLTCEYEDYFDIEGQMETVNYHGYEEVIL